MIPVNNEDKESWCIHGEELEREFLVKSFNSGLAVYRNPQKVENKYANDLYVVMPSDLKSIRTPFRTANRYGIDPRFAITINEKDLLRYKDKHPMMLVVLDIKHDLYTGLHIAQLGHLITASENGRAKRHEYMARINDVIGNARASFVYDCRWFPSIPEHTKNNQTQ
jgi:hypothetical protein